VVPVKELLLLVWEGFWVIGQGFGMTGVALTRFADLLWIGLASLVALWIFSTVAAVTL